MTFNERVIEVMRWPASRKTALLAGAMMPAHGYLWWELNELQLRHDDVVTRALDEVAGGAMLAMAVFCALGISADWRGRAMKWLPYAFAVAYALFITRAVQVSWQVISVSWIPLAALLFAFHFNEKVGATLLGACLVLIVGLEVFMPQEAPSDSADVNETVGTLWERVTAILVVLNFVYCAAVLGAQQVLERRLQGANRLIRRYLPAQLADRILAGGHVEGAKHERRKLTIVFTDVVGFTALSDEVDSEELATLLNEYLAEMTTVADRFGATVNQLIGDGIMIFFGAPTATDDRDHAQRAVCMAQAMQKRMAELREHWFKRGLQRPFRIRIGINSGFASVGDFGSPGRMMYSAIGQQTNLAARIQAHCAPDRILLSHSTWGLVQDAVQCKLKGEIQVKGLHYPVLVYEVSDGATERAA